jgi:hypothetical protein
VTLKGRILATAAPFVAAVAYDTLILGARVLGVLRTIEENRATFHTVDAKPHLTIAMDDYAAWWRSEQERRAA